MKKEDKYREVADKIWELSKLYSDNKQIMNILRDCASELHIEARKHSLEDDNTSRIASLYLIKKEFNF